LLPLQLFRFLRQVGEISFQCSASKQLATPLQRFSKLFLRFGQLLEGGPGALGIEILERLLEGGELLTKLGRQRALELIPYLGKLPLPGGVVETGGLGTLAQRLERLLQCFGLLDQLLLRLGRTLGALCLLIGQ
jgi:hypothetical protein